MKVLIADDEVTSRILLEETLQDWGYETVSTCDGLEAFNAMQEADAPNLLILDWMMPGLDGTALCRKLRESQNSQYVYIILLTSKSTKKDVILGMDCGADAFLTKPVDLEELKCRLAAGKRILAHQSHLNNKVASSPTQILPAVEMNSAPGGIAEMPEKLQSMICDLSRDTLLALAPRKRIGKRVVPSLGKVLILKRIGEGGMGAVYHGYNPRMQKEVAVKVLSTTLFRERADAAQRFYREAQIAAMVRSENLVTVSDVDQEQGIIYLVMELVHGITAVDCLEKAIREGNNGLPESVALDICIAAAKGLAAAHVSGIIHRDVKPDNILIPVDAVNGPQYGAAKMADLGVARHETESEGLTGTNVALGTAGFMSPEQIRDAKHAGKASDVFGLGATLYALLTGRAPFMGASAFVIFGSTISDPHAPVATWRPDVSTGTLAIIETALQKRAEDRYPDCAAMLEDLQYCRNVLEATGKPLDDVAEESPPAESQVVTSAPSEEPLDCFGFPCGSIQKSSDITKRILRLASDPALVAR